MGPSWLHRMPLAIKCLVLFGAAVLLIALLALSLPWFRMNQLVEAGQAEVGRELLEAWRQSEGGEVDLQTSRAEAVGDAVVTVVGPNALAARRTTDRFLDRAVKRFIEDPTRFERIGGEWRGWSRVYRSASVHRDERGAISVVLLERRSDDAGMQLAVNTLYLFAAGSVVLAVALIVFYVLTSRLILAPVQSLKMSAERVRDGDLDERSDIQTGDEFEELAETFNLMLEELEEGRSALEAINVALDVKLAEVREANNALYESAKLKGEFLAGISHELRTPLNSIIGFADLLLEIAVQERRRLGNAEPDKALVKRERYLSNIVTAGRTLLEMIESLLEMAKLEAGKIDVHPAPTNVTQLCQGLVGLMEPQARQRGVSLSLDVVGTMPTIMTDTKKLQQIVLNLLNNAVKFSDPEHNNGRPGEVVLRVDRVAPAGDGETFSRIRMSVIDNGPGISSEDQARVFEKFQQLDAGLTRGNHGAGLGLAICKELAGVLQAELRVDSEVGRGSMFSLILPEKIDTAEAEEHKLESRFKGALARSTEWADASG